MRYPIMIGVVIMESRVPAKIKGGRYTLTGRLTYFIMKYPIRAQNPVNKTTVTNTFPASPISIGSQRGLRLPINLPSFYKRRVREDIFHL